MCTVTVSTLKKTSEDNCTFLNTTLSVSWPSLSKYYIKPNTTELSAATTSSSGSIPTIFLAQLISHVI